VHDPRPLGVAARDAVVEQRVDERPLLLARARVDDRPGRLVDDEQVLVLIGDSEVDRLRDEGRGRRGRLELDLLPALEPVALRAAGAVDEGRARLDQPLGRGA
jgi:hypothetical protein